MRIKILHVLHGMDRGGIETWLMHVARHIDRNRFQMDFLVHTTKHCAYDDELRELGCRIFPYPFHAQPVQYAAKFETILQEAGGYDVIHSHLHHYSGFVMRLAKRAEVPKRIAHSHNDTKITDLSPNSIRRIYLAMMKRWISQFATHGLACSDQAGRSLFASSWEVDQRWSILRYGIDLCPFRQDVDSNAIRHELGIPVDSHVIGHVGRFAEQKNHRFLLSVASEVMQRDPKAMLLLIGEGQLKPQIENEVKQLQIEDKVIFAGVRDDVPRLMLGAMDVFLFPSLYEGLGLVLLEAQASCIPSVISDTVPSEVDLTPSLIHRLSISQPVIDWAEIVTDVMINGPKIVRKHALWIIEQSGFNIERSIENLERFYDK